MEGQGLVQIILLSGVRLTVVCKIMSILFLKCAVWLFMYGSEAHSASHLLVLNVLEQLLVVHLYDLEYYT